MPAQWGTLGIRAINARRLVEIYLVVTANTRLVGTACHNMFAVLLLNSPAATARLPVEPSPM
jgi:hypothetical protein